MSFVFVSVVAAGRKVRAKVFGVCFRCRCRCCRWIIKKVFAFKEFSPPPLLCLLFFFLHSCYIKCKTLEYLYVGMCVLLRTFILYENFPRLFISFSPKNQSSPQLTKVNRREKHIKKRQPCIWKFVCAPLSSSCSFSIWSIWFWPWF